MRKACQMTIGKTHPRLASQMILNPLFSRPAKGIRKIEEGSQLYDRRKLNSYQLCKIKFVFQVKLCFYSLNMHQAF